MSTDTYLNIVGNPNTDSFNATGGDSVVASMRNYTNRDGFDLIWKQEYLQKQIASIEDDIREIEQNANLSDTEKMYSMQMAMNTWSAVTNLRTNILKSVSDTLKTIVRNVA